MSTLTQIANPFLSARILEMDRVCKMDEKELAYSYQMIQDAMPKAIAAGDSAILHAVSKNHALLSARIDEVRKADAEPVEDGTALQPISSDAEVSKSESVQLYCEFVSKSDAKRLVTGIILVPDEVDKQGDIVSAEAIEELAYNFMSDYRAQESDMGEMHTDMRDDIQLVESYLAPQELTFGTKIVKRGSWIVTSKVLNDDAWKKVEDGTYRGYSIKGLLPCQQLEEDEAA